MMSSCITGYISIKRTHKKLEACPPRAPLIAQVSGTWSPGTLSGYLATLSGLSAPFSGAASVWKLIYHLSCRELRDTRIKPRLQPLFHGALYELKGQCEELFNVDYFLS